MRTLSQIWKLESAKFANKYFKSGDIAKYRRASPHFTITKSNSCGYLCLLEIYVRTNADREND